MTLVNRAVRDPNPLLVADASPARPVPPLPIDPGLPHLADVLDGRVILQALRGVGMSDVQETRPRYVRYKPGNKAIVLYDVNLSGQRTVAVITASARRNLAKLCHTPQVAELAELVRTRTAASTPVMVLDRPKALVEWFPVNRLIPALALPPAWLGDHLARCGHRIPPAVEPLLLAYKPERRAVARWGDVIVKAYARRDDFDQAVHGFAAANGVRSVRVPALIVAIPEAKVTLQTSVPGTRPDSDRREDLGRALAMLHSSAVNSPFRTTAQDHLLAAKQTCRHLAFLLPALRSETERLIGRLERELPDSGPLVPSHGDFHEGQALAHSRELAVIDFDHACISHPALDLATFAAHLVDGRESSVGSALLALDDLLRGYGRRPKDLGWFLAVAILRRSAAPFRSLALDWPARVAGMVRAAAAVVSSPASELGAIGAGAFSTPRRARIPDWGRPSEATASSAQATLNPYVFIVGAARSGTTLLQRMVDSHPEIAVVNETYWLPRKFRPETGLTPDGLVTERLVAQLMASPKFERMGLGREVLEQLSAAAAPISYTEFVSRLFDLYAQARGKPLAGDKTPGYVRKIEQVHGLWPAARFVHLIRDGRDVCLSMVAWGKGEKTAGQYGTWSRDPVVSTALYWRRSVLLGQEAGSALGPGRYREFRYESLVTRPREDAEAICDFLDVQFDEAMLRFHEGRTKPAGTRSSKARWLPPRPGLRDWRSQMDASSLERFEAAAGDLLEELGYVRFARSPSDGTFDHVARIKENLEMAAAKRGRRFPRGW